MNLSLDRYREQARREYEAMIEDGVSPDMIGGVGPHGLGLPGIVGGEGIRRLPAVNPDGPDMSVFYFENDFLER